MTIRLFGVIAVVLGLSGAAVAAPQEVERVLRIYDVSLLVEPIDVHVDKGLAGISSEETHGRTTC